MKTAQAVFTPLLCTVYAVNRKKSLDRFHTACQRLKLGYFRQRVKREPGKLSRYLKKAVSLFNWIYDNILD